MHNESTQPENENSEILLKLSKNIFLRRQMPLESLSKIQNSHSRVVWIHCASLGEFEQGRPIIEALKKEFPETLYC